MRNLLIGIALAITPCMSTIASEPNEIINKPGSVDQQFNYVDVAVGPLPCVIPALKLGYRTQNNHHGIDIAVQGIVIYPLFSYVKGSMAYQHYFCPNPCSQVYIGLGAGVGKVFEHCFSNDSLPFIGPEFSIGKQYTNEAGKTRFVQVQLNSPIYTFKRNHSRTIHAPYISLSYGMGF